MVNKHKDLKKLLDVLRKQTNAINSNVDAVREHMIKKKKRTKQIQMLNKQ